MTEKAFSYSWKRRDVVSCPAFCEIWSCCILCYLQTFKLCLGQATKKTDTIVWQNPSRTCPSRWRGRNHRSHDNPLKDLADRRMAHPMDPVLSHHTSQERRPAAKPELPNDQPHKPPKQSHAEDHPQQIEVASGEDHCWRTSRLQSRKEHQIADLQPKNPLWEVSPAPAKLVLCFHRLQESLRQGSACSFVGNHEEVQHQRQPYSSHQSPLR